MSFCEMDDVIRSSVPAKDDSNFISLNSNGTKP